MKDYIQLGIDKGLIFFNEERSRIKYNWQKKERNYNNPEEKVLVLTFLQLILDYVKSCEQWTETELKLRQQELLKVFMNLWPMPTTGFEVTKQEAESVSLDDEDFEFTGKKLQAYILHGVRYTVNTWKEMLVQVCGHILLEKRSTLEWLCANEKSGFYTMPESWRREIAPNMYVWTDNSTATKISILSGMFAECNVPTSELIFEFSSDQEGEDE